MAVARWLETDTYSNKDISTAVSIGVYTADADRVIVCDVSIDQAAGNGDYVVYLTRQINGSGSSYVLLPKTTCAAASGETAIAMQSGMVTVRSGDVLTVYLDGLAGDNSTPDTTVRWFELAALRPTTADRTLDVSSGGEAGVDWGNIGSPTTTVSLSGTTVKTATDVETDTADIQTRIGTAGAGLTALPWNAAWDAEVQSEAADALDAYDPPTKAELDAAAALLATAANLATLAGYVDTEVAAILAAVDTEVAAIKAKTDNLPADPADQSAMEAAIMAAVGGIPAAPTPEAIHDWLVADTPIPVDVQEWMGDTPLDLVTGKVQAEATVTIEPQDVADALKLAPTAGEPAAGSVYDLIAGIEAGTGLTAQETADAVHNLAPAGTPAAGSVGDKLNDLPATILTTAVAAYAGTPGTFGYLLSLLAGLDFTQVNLVAASNAGEITIKRTLTLAAVVSGLTIPADWTACYWTVKRSVDDADADAIIQILASNPPDADDGLLVLMGAAVEDQTAGSLAVNQALGTVTIALDDASTAALEDAVELVWDVKVHAPAGKTQPGAGTATITTAVTRT